MSKSHKQSTQVHQCSFQATISHTNAAVRFSCKMFLAWKSMSNKTFCRTLNDNVAVQNGIATFNQSLTIQTYMLFDKTIQKYLRKQTSLCLMLISARKPDEQKLVGRVTVDLAQILNDNTYSEIKDHKLNFCSIANATISFKVINLVNNKTGMRAIDLDMDQFSSISISKGLSQNESSNSDAFKSIAKDLSASKQKSEQASKRNSELIKQQQRQIYHQKPLSQIVQPQLIQSQIKQQVLIDDQKIQQQPLKGQKTQRQGKMVETARFTNSNNQDGDNLLVSFAPRRPQGYQNKQPIKDNDFMIKKTFEHQIIVQDMQKTIKRFEQQLPDMVLIDSNPGYKQQPQTNKQKQKQKQNILLPNTQLISSINNDDTFQLKFMNKKLEGQNQKLIQLLQQSNRSVTQYSQIARKWQSSYNDLATKIKLSQQQKQQLKKQLQNQIQQNTKKCQQVALAVKKSEDSTALHEQIHKLNLKIEEMQKQYDQSEKVRLDIQSELLEIRFQLSQLKSEREGLDNLLKNKDEELDKLYKYIEEYQNSKTQEQVDKSALFKSYSLMSDKQREGYHQEIEALKRKLNKLSNEIKFTQNVKTNLNELTHAFDGANTERQILIVELQNLRAQKQEWMKQRNNQLQSQLRKSPSQLDLQTKLECVQQQLKAVLALLERNQLQTTKLQMANRQLSEQNRYLQQSLTNLQTQYEKSNQLLKSYEQQLSNKQNALLLKQNQFDTYKNQIKLKQIEQSKAKETEKQNQQQIVSLKLQLQKTVKQNQARLLQLNTNNQQNDTLNITIKQQQIQLQKLRENSNKLAEVQAKAENSDNQNKKLQIELSQFKSVITTLEKQRQNSKNQKNQYKQKIEQLSGQNQALKNKLAKAQQQSKAKKQSQSSAVTANIVIKNHLDKLAEKDKKIEQLSCQLESETAKIAELEQRIARFSEKQLKMRQNILILEDQSRKIYDIVVQKQQNQQFQAQVIEEKDSQIDNLRGQLNEQITLLQISTEELNQYKRQVFDMRRQQSPNAGEGGQPQQVTYTNDQSPNDEAIRQLNNLLKNSNDRIIELQQIINYKQQQIIKQYNERLQVMAQLQKQFQQSTRDVNSLRQQMQKLNEQKIQLTRENNNLKYELSKQKQRRQSMEQVQQLRKNLQNNNENNKIFEQKISSLQAKYAENRANLNIRDQVISEYEAKQQEYKIKISRQQKIMNQLQASEADSKLNIKILQKIISQIEAREEESRKSMGNAISQYQHKQQQLFEQLNNRDSLIKQLQIKQSQCLKTINQQDGIIFKLSNQVSQLQEFQNKAKQLEHSARQYQNRVKELESKAKSIKHQAQQKIHQNSQQAHNNQDLMNQLAFHQERIKNLQSEIQTLQLHLSEREKEVHHWQQQFTMAKSQNDENDVEKEMKNQLQKQLQLLSKSQVKTKQAIHSVGLTPIDIVQACRSLKELIRQRSQKDKSQSIIQLMVGKNAMLEEQLSKITEQRGVIQENARKLSMEFQKIKFKILKGKGSYQQKNQILVSLKPCEGKVKYLVELTERLSDNQLQNQND